MTVAKIKVKASRQELAGMYLKEREGCEKRGYHLVEDDTVSDPLICYDCEIFFGKDDRISYKVQTL